MNHQAPAGDGAGSPDDEPFDTGEMSGFACHVIRVEAMHRAVLQVLDSPTRARKSINYRDEDWRNRLSAATGGAGFDVAFASIGGTVAHAFVSSLATHGQFVGYGAASGYRVPNDRARRRSGPWMAHAPGATPVQQKTRERWASRGLSSLHRIA
ncbi:zinc-binding dehydrogenase [Burkholderia puraquae]|uniref:zinc-binding dehydrogenase n=1 Tax=Burkholderia puraquae TaxID=1904757 RepID=UPI001054DC54|nr:zinc-binding dehydrogenase [Burkholderia puraquae]